MSDLAIDCLTTQSLVPINSVFPVLEVLRKFLLWQKFRLVWMDYDRQQYSHVCASFNEPILEERWAGTGVIAIEDLTGKSWSAGFQRVSYSHTTFKQKSPELRQNEMTVSISGDS